MAALCPTGEIYNLGHQTRTNADKCRWLSFQWRWFLYYYNLDLSFLLCSEQQQSTFLVPQLILNVCECIGETGILFYFLFQFFFCWKSWRRPSEIPRRVFGLVFIFFLFSGIVKKNLNLWIFQFPLALPEIESKLKIHSIAHGRLRHVKFLNQVSQ